MVENTFLRMLVIRQQSITNSFLLETLILQILDGTTIMK